MLNLERVLHSIKLFSTLKIRFKYFDLVLYPKYLLSLMKKFTLLMGLVIAACFGFNTVQAQGATKKAVVLEIATGTWCTFCPGSSIGSSELIDNGWPVVVIKNHEANGDPFETTESAARNNYYNVSGFPTSTFDGDAGFSGGSATNSLYGSYLPYLLEAMNAPTPFDIDMSFSRSNDTILADVDISQMGTYSGPLNVFFVVTESKIQYSWQNQSEVNYANRLMLPDANGRAVTIAMGQTVTESFGFVIDPSWVDCNLEISTFVQNMTTGEIFNATKAKICPPTEDFDQELANVANVPTGYNCDNSYAPQILVRNHGSDTIGSFTIDYDVTNSAGTTSGQFTWTGNLAGPLPIVVNLPSLTYTPGLNSKFNATMTNVLDLQGNAVTDANTNNPTSYAQPTQWDYLEEDGGMYTFNITTDNYGYETYWQITDGAGTVQASGGNPTVGANGGGLQVAAAGNAGAYGNGTLYTETVMLSGADCYELLVVDDWGDGICCSVGQGSYELLNPYGQQIITGGQFGIIDDPNWSLTSVVSVDESLDGEVAIFPNPNNGTFTVRVSDLVTDGQLTIVSLDGRRVFDQAITSSEMDVRLDIAAGTYMVTVTSNGRVTTQKIDIR